MVNITIIKLFLVQTKNYQFLAKSEDEDSFKFMNKGIEMDADLNDWSNREGKEEMPIMGKELEILLINLK